MILEILLIGFILYCAYQVIAIPLYAFGFFGTIIVVAFVIPLLILAVDFYFTNTGIAWLVIGILVLLGILASRGTTVAK
tara:strand:- start:174 stop:410 length:237 start_codon:yes stop_codon:yes gene_type:complete